MNSSNHAPVLQPRSRALRVLRIALLLLTALSALVALFYAVENWRGQRALDRSRRELAAKGEKLEWADWLPKAVAEESNFFKAPGMTALFVKTAGLDASTNDSGSFAWPPVPEGYGRDYPFLMADLKQLPGQSTRPEERSLARLQQWFQQHESLLQQLESAARRPQAQLERHPDAPFGGPMINFVNLRKIAQWLAMKAEVDLLAGHPEETVRSLALVARLVEITRDDRPAFLVQYMIGVALAGMHVQIVQDGLADHLWPEPQLAACQAQLQKMELLASLPETFRAERAGSGYLLEHWPRSRLVEVFKEAKWSASSLFIRLSPRGWLLQNRALGNRVIQDFVEALDAAGQAVTPNRMGQELKQELDSRSPYNYLAAMAMPNLGRATQAAARNQSFIRQAAIACALERYRLAHGEHPDSLAALVPRFIERVPADVISGEGFRYRRLSDGSYLLYSVGWNGTDDGGVAADWVWNVKSR